MKLKTTEQAEQHSRSAEHVLWDMKKTDTFSVSEFVCTITIWEVSEDYEHISVVCLLDIAAPFPCSN